MSPYQEGPAHAVSIPSQGQPDAFVDGLYHESPPVAGELS